MEDDKLANFRHSLAHLLAAAVLELYPDAKQTIGPAIENGFYYDFEFQKPIRDDELLKIEEKMREILPSWKSFEREEINLEEAKKLFVGNPYKLELIEEYKDQGLTIYKSGEYTDLCRGGHVDDPSKINPAAFKLTHTAGAYWRGSEKNKMLTRIYGLAFETPKELEKHLEMQKEAEKRDHKKLGVELDLFVFSELVGSGLPLFTPKGTMIRDLLDNFVWELRQQHDYEKVDIPHITKKDLYEKSGHWEKFKDELFKIETREGHLFAMKPMNCPHHTQIYARKPHSYRELPQRYVSTTKVYRDEQSGELAGLSRVLSITQDDAHVFCRITQVKNEIQKIWDIVHTFYEAVDLKLELHLSLRDPDNPKKYLGNKEYWDEAEKILREVAKENKTPYIEVPGEAAFYAPKLDFMATDSLGREWQVATIQIDVHMPNSFNLSCINEKGEKEGIVMIHAAVMGSIERFLSVLIEHYAGAFPLWLAPVQVSVLPISDKFNDYAGKVVERLKESGIRVELDDRNESIGKKIRDTELQKIPYLAIIGAREKEADTVALRRRGQGDLGAIKIEELVRRLTQEIKEKK